MNIYTLVAVAFESVVITGKNVCDPTLSIPPTDNSEVTLGQLRPGNGHFRLLHFHSHLMELRLARFVSVAMDPLNSGSLWSEYWYMYHIQKEAVRFSALTQSFLADFTTRSIIHTF